MNDTLFFYKSDQYIKSFIFYIKFLRKLQEPDPF